MVLLPYDHQSSKGSSSKEFRLVLVGATCVREAGVAVFVRGETNSTILALDVPVGQSVQVGWIVAFLNRSFTLTGRGYEKISRLF
jgi:hypothetical protein